MRDSKEQALKFELYFPDGQEYGRWIKGFDLDAHLREIGLIDRCLSLEDEAVRGWLADPSTYPEEFKDKNVFLWKSQQDRGDYRFVAYLAWHWRNEHVSVYWRCLRVRWGSTGPALLTSSSIP